jgi:DNA-3-methyladenine glycosylase II
MIVRCVSPYDFDLSMSLFSNGDRQIRRFEEGKFWQVVRIDRKLFLLTLKAVGTVYQPKIAIDLSSNQSVSAEEERKCGQLSSIIVNADLDLGPFYSDVDEDVTMRQIVRKLLGLKVPCTSTVYEALIDSIIEQQISLNVAHVLQNSLIKKFGDRLSLECGVYYAYPAPHKLASSTTEEMRKIGLSARKAEYIQNISRMIVSGELNLEAFRNYSNVTRIIEELDKIRGIGKWTAELTIVRGLQRYDAIPADDLGLRRAIAHFYCRDEKITGDEARKIAEKWGRWKGLASFYLVMAETLGILKKGYQ